LTGDARFLTRPRETEIDSVRSDILTKNRGLTAAARLL